MQETVKPNPKKLKRQGVRSAETGFLDKFYIALHEDVIGFPSFEQLSVDTPYASGMIASGNFRTVDSFNTINPNGIFFTTLWSEIVVKKNSIKLDSKPLNLKDSSGIETTLTFAFDNALENLGFREMYKRADIQLIVPKANGDYVWIGRRESPAQIEDFSDTQGIEKSAEELQIKCSPYSYAYYEIVFFQPPV